MPSELAERSARPNKFTTRFCEPCGKDTYHYQPGDEPPHCTKSATHPGARKQELPAVIQQGSLQEKPKQLTDAQFRRANMMDRALWRNAEQRSSQIRSDSAWVKDVRALFTDSEANAPLDPNETLCSFCGLPTQKIHLTSERRPMIRKTIETMRDSNGEIWQKERVMATVQELHACPNCCLKIRNPVIVTKV